MAKPEPEITATLIRGKNYIYENIHFVLNTPKKITAEMADALEGIYDEVIDAEKQMIHKPMFRIDYHADKPDSKPKNNFGQKKPKFLEKASTDEDEGKPKTVFRSRTKPPRLA